MAEKNQEQETRAGQILGYALLVFFILVIFALPWSVGVMQIFRFFTGM
jgi:hypothetical protein